MAGHSKWKNIRIRKGKQDAIRGKLFTKLGREIIIAAKLGGGDPDDNPRLRTAILKAREHSLPKENIDRAIARGTGKVDGADYEEILYEGVGPGGVAFMVDVYSENRNRTVGDLRHAFSKNGGNLTENGSVAWQFKQCGQIVIAKEDIDEDSLVLSALEGGAEDVNTEDADHFVIETAVEDLHSCMTALENDGYAAVESSLTRIPTNFSDPSEKEMRQTIRLIDALEDLDDVKETFINADIPEALLEED
jgi:YebC/PmpR family DNA-binding regulatory protein